MDAESAVVALVLSAHAWLAGSEAGGREPAHAAASSVAIATPSNATESGGRTRTEPTNPSTLSAAGALTLQLLELRSYGRDVPVERGLVTRAQAKISSIRRDGRFAIANRCPESTLFAEVSCGNGACLRPGRNGPPLGAGFSETCAAMSCCADILPANGCRPASSSYAITPHA